MFLEQEAEVEEERQRKEREAREKQDEMTLGKWNCYLINAKAILKNMFIKCLGRASKADLASIKNNFVCLWFNWNHK